MAIVLVAIVKIIPYFSLDNDGELYDITKVLYPEKGVDELMCVNILSNKLALTIDHAFRIS